MDTGAVILTSFLSTIPVYLFFATGFYLRHKQVIQADHDAPIMLHRDGCGLPLPRLPQHHEIHGALRK